VAADIGRLAGPDSGQKTFHLPQQVVRATEQSSTLISLDDGATLSHSRMHAQSSYPGISAGMNSPPALALTCCEEISPAK
jgi:hypothetical protein